MLKIDELLEGSVLLFDKPLGWTSFDLVKKARAVIKTLSGVKKFKIGHAGTLDPLASGLLIVCVGKKTKTIDQIQLQDKEYNGVFFIGATTSSFDLESEVDEKFPVGHITDELIQETARKFIGEQNQIPPQFSAVKINGKRAYEYARQGQDVKIEPKAINIYDFRINKIEMPYVHFTVVCSKGTYIRSLARDFGLSLNSGAHLVELVRTKIGDYTLENALKPYDFQERIIVNK